MGAGAVTIASAGAAVGIGDVFNSLIHSMAWNPSLAKQSFGYCWRTILNRQRYENVYEFMQVAFKLYQLLICMCAGSLHVNKDTQKIFKVVRSCIIPYVHCYLITAIFGKGFNSQSPWERVSRTVPVVVELCFVTKSGYSLSLWALPFFSIFSPYLTTHDLSPLFLLHLTSYFNINPHHNTSNHRGK